ncbi:MAG: dinitrogenase iron-molybdenum cofactor biosynthesis protein [Bacteroidetes bacterium HGW-Bacteroidetes-17]|jgi:predicted Fe-Mo cluster-binding NifX family protein|nr:MAG: dinitrogenase iron-molybdenum cofactor biosynthesis protein [Bacteroidetes bacterium HGW-Bacteroidetes-17]
MKKIAVPTRNDIVDAHFGHCEHYSIFTINEKNVIIDKELYAAPQGCGCKSNIAPLLAEKGVYLMLAGNMGMGAVNVLQSSNIEVLRGCEGKVDEVVGQYLSGVLSDSGESCAHHGSDDHQCEHH